jgi:NAD(P)H-dependent FMN reductase
MSKPSIAIILSTTRQGRFADKAGPWIRGLVAERSDMTSELLDLRDYPMPFFDEPASNAWVPSKNEVAQRWQHKVASFDGYLFVVAEYNRGLPAVLKNALDYAYPEWNRKAAAFVGYGSVGAARSIEQLRASCIELQLAPTRHGVHIQGSDFMAVYRDGKDLKQQVRYLEPNVTTMLDELHWWASALMVARKGASE